MAVTCTTDSLATESACFDGYSPRQADAVMIYLLAVIAGVDPDPEALAEDATCFEGLSPRQSAAVQTYLLCQIANA